MLELATLFTNARLRRPGGLAVPDERVAEVVELGFDFVEVVLDFEIVLDFEVVLEPPAGAAAAEAAGCIIAAGLSGSGSGLLSNSFSDRYALERTFSFVPLFVVLSVFLLVISISKTGLGSATSGRARVMSSRTASSRNERRIPCILTKRRCNRTLQYEQGK